MPRTYEKRHPVSVDYLCDMCNDGYMRYTGTTLTTNPPWYQHKCDKCGHIENMADMYPRIEYRAEPLKAQR